MKFFRFFILLSVPFVLFVSCGGGNDDVSASSEQGKTCETKYDCPIGYYCDTASRRCTQGGGSQDDPGDSGTNEDNEGSSDPGEQGKQDGDDDPITGKCTPGKTQTCSYEGPAGTEGIGACKAAIRTCDENGKWGKCEGGHEPVDEIGELCGNGIDDDCNGKIDDGTDLDGDGYGACSDCCELESDCVGLDPAGINPGGVEMPEDGVDNNCNGKIDEPTSCDGEDGQLTVGDYAGNAVKLAHAMGICGDQLVSAEISLAGDPATENIANDSCGTSHLFTGTTYDKSNRTSLSLPYFEDDYKTFAAAAKFGNNITPLEGSKMAILSTGQWDNPTKDEECAKLSSGDMKTASTIPEDWINMMPDCTIPKAPSCGGTAVDDNLSNQCEGKNIPSVQDPIMLTLKVKVPVNVRAFEFRLFFFSVEYPNTVCSKNNYNDFFIALLDSKNNETYPEEEQNPHDKNLAKDEKGNPVGVDLAPNGLFQVCGSNGSYSENCTQGTTLLEGTGFDKYSSGGTGWLVTRGNVVPGETITLRLALWEQGEVGYGPDHSWDSTVLLDGFKWLPAPAKAGTSQQ